MARSADDNDAQNAGENPDLTFNQAVNRDEDEATDDQSATCKLKDLVNHLQNRSGGITSPQTHREPGQPIHVNFSNQLPVAPTTRPGMRECNWEQFKNRFSDEPLYSIETLIGEPDLRLQVLDESIRRGTSGPAGPALNELSSAMTRKGSSPQIHRIRIQSGVILHLLNTVSGDSWDITKSHTFMRPFGYLIHHQGRVKKELESLESQLSRSQRPGSEALSSLEEEHAKTGSKITAESVLQEIRAYVEFVDNSLIPLYQQFENTSDGSRNIQFDDLWYLFRPGELVYGTHESDANHQTQRGRDSASSGRQKLWRVCTIHPHSQHLRDNVLYNDNDIALKKDSDSPSEVASAGSCVISCYSLDYDGERVVPVWKKVEIKPFLDEKEIRTLEAYPVRFLSDSQTVLIELKDQGRKFLDCVKLKHMLCNGWILLHEPDGSWARDYDGDVMKYSEQYLGEVIVDFKEAFDDNPHWRFVHRPSRPYEVKSSKTIEPYRVIRWAESERSTALVAHYEVVVQNDDVQRFELFEYLDTDRFIGHTPEELNDLPLSDEDLALLPRRLYAYLLRFRSFRLIDVHDLKPIVAQTNAFDKLQIDDFNKKTIQSVIHSHLKRKAIAAINPEIDSPDIIRGKGRGLVILIQGAPGVGKTATAEAVAQANERPLFSINFDDIDHSAEMLSRLFRRAEMWECIVLLDEVDVYLAHRTPHDHAANLLVSLFLRVLENFSGILFLTTNRPGALDEAVKSRVQVNLCYKPLNLNQTLEIFKLNMERLARTEEQRSAVSGDTTLAILDDQVLAFAEEHYRKHASQDGLGCWNGRQIRNAFLIASSLAHYEVLNKPKIQPQLRASHFEEVERLTLDYDRSRAKTLGKSDTQLALEREERYDFSEQPQPARERQSSPSYSLSSLTVESRGNAPTPAPAAVRTNAGVSPRSGFSPSPLQARHRGPEVREPVGILRDSR